MVRGIKFPVPNSGPKPASPYSSHQKKTSNLVSHSQWLRNAIYLRQDPPKIPSGPVPRSFPAVFHPLRRGGRARQVLSGAIYPSYHPKPCRRETYFDSNGPTFAKKNKTERTDCLCTFTYRLHVSFRFVFFFLYLRCPFFFFFLHRQYTRKPAKT